MIKPININTLYAPNKSLQRTFDPPHIFADAKTGVASNAAEFRRYVLSALPNGVAGAEEK